MGVWGTAISSNDTYADVRGEFFDLYNDEVEISEISKGLIQRNHETINDADDANNFWFALANAQWECGQLDSTLLSRISDIIETGADIDVWRRLNACEKDLQMRARSLTAFLTKLRSENVRPRARKQKTIKNPPFKKGDCLAFKLNNGNYGGAIILEAAAMKGFGMNLVATTRINNKTIPTIQDFSSAELLLLNFATYQDEPMVNWKYSVGFRKEKDLFSTIGQIDINKKFDPDAYSSPYKYGGHWASLIEVASLQFESEKTKPRSKQTVRIRRLTWAPRWKLL